MIGLLIQMAVLAVRLMVMALALMIRGSILLAAAIGGALSSRRGGSRASAAYGRQRMDPHLRWSVFQRDGYACVHCGATADLTVDHIHPVSLGGLDDASNLQTLCRPCNSAKGIS